MWRWQGSSEERPTLECLGSLLRILAGGQGDKKADELPDLVSSEAALMGV